MTCQGLMTHERSHAPNSMIIMCHSATQYVCTWNTQGQSTVNNTLTRRIFYHHDIRDDMHRYNFFTSIVVFHENDQSGI